jgi:hypothetical protein
MLNFAPQLLSQVTLGTWAKSIPQQIVPVFLGANDGLFPAIVTAVRPIAVVGLIFRLYAMIPDFPDTEKLADNINKIFWSAVIAFVIVNANAAKYVAIFQWAAIGGINEEIAYRIEKVTDVSKLIKNYEGDRQAMAEIQKKVNACQQISAIDAQGNPNPAMAACQGELSNQIQTASTNGSIKQPDLLTKLGGLGGAILTGDIGKIAGEINGVAANFLSGFASPVLSIIFSGWRSVIESIAPIAIFVSILSLPIPLCLSVFDLSPLMVWFSSLWAVGIFEFSLTILTKTFEYLTATYGSNVSIYFLDIGVCIFAPVIAGFMAAGGGIAVFKATLGAAVEVAKSGVEVGMKLVKNAVPRSGSREWNG